MSKKTTLKEWVLDLMTTNPTVRPSLNGTVRLMCSSTGEIRVERVRLDWWDDEDFRYGYEALRADEGFILVSEPDLRGQAAVELETYE